MLFKSTNSKNSPARLRLAVAGRHLDRTRLRFFVCGAVVLLLTSLGVSAVRAVSGDDRADGGTTAAAIIEIEGELTDITLESVNRRVDEAVAQGAKIIIFDLDTPGGLVTSSIAIADAIKNLENVKTVAWVNPNAHSGGSIVAVACNEIVMAKSSRIGDSQVIMGGPAGAAAIPEELQPKAYTPVLAEFRSSARLRGYDQNLCEAFVLPQREVWWLENTETGEREFVFRDEKLARFGEKPDPPAGKEKKAEADEESTEVGGSLLEQARDLLAKRDKESTEAGGDDDTDDEAIGARVPRDSRKAGEPKWKLVEKYYDILLEMEVDAIQPVVRDDQLLEMSAGEAHAYGFSKGIVKDEDDLRERYALGSMIHLHPNWSETFAFWLTSMYVRGFLLVIILLGAYVEFHTPGVGVPGLVALIALAVFVGAPYLTGLANVWEILFIVIGVGLVALEVFVIPGFGVAGISGGVLILVGLLATFVPDEPGRSFPLYFPSLPATLEWLKTGIATLVSSMLVSAAGMVVLSRFLPKIPLFRAIVPANPTPSDVAVADPYHGAARVGDVGRTEGPLHPSGKARFGSVLVDVVTQGDFLSAGTTVVVVERRGNRVVVRSSA